MRTVTAILLLVSLAFARDYSKHFISAAIIPIDPGLIYPDIWYEYHFTENDAVGFASVVGGLNRITYSRKIHVFRLTGSFGYMTPDYDYSMIETFRAISVEWRQPLGEELFSRLTATGVFLDDMPFDLPVIPIFQIGLGLSF